MSLTIQGSVAPSVDVYKEIIGILLRGWNKRSDVMSLYLINESYWELVCYDEDGAKRTIRLVSL